MTQELEIRILTEWCIRILTEWCIRRHEVLTFDTPHRTAVFILCGYMCKYDKKTKIAYIPKLKYQLP